ncbi:hypothetical protein PHMEG_00021162 [Phytophthora megakarya]|uniref:Reverse transcriptase n=1 Tax=Phytophthora megakarya TaxID=4795 RepID=A0A225VLX4_9STRA|nr:hypothetical protein PHMEG_00021162 [Phytophthora megakarya]
MENKFRQDSAKATPTGAASAVVSSVSGVAREYIEATEERCKDGKENISAVPKSVKSSFEDDLLTTLCEASSGVSNEALTDKLLLKKIHELTDCYQDQVLPPVNDLLLKELKMNMGNSDVQSRVTDYFLSCNKVIKNNRWSKLSTIVLWIERNRLFAKQSHTSPDNRSRVKGAWDPLNNESQTSGQRRLQHGKLRKSETVVSNATRTERQKMFFHWGGEHYFSNCPTATKKDHECLNAKLSKMVARPGRTLLIVLEDCFSVAFCADSGTNRSGMSITVYKEFMKVCPEVREAKLDQPLTCKDANGKPITVTMIVNLHLRLRTVAGSVRIAVPVQDADEFLLGNDMLKMLGIGVQRQLGLFVANVLQTDEDDEFDDQDEPQIGSSIGIYNDLKVVVEHLVKSAIVNEFPKEPAGEFHRIATRFDIWQLKFGDDPPARVPPMKIRLKPGAQPYRCEVRCYPHEVRRFLDDFNDELVRLGWVYENAESGWACSVLPVRSGGDFRQTADYKPVNAHIEALCQIFMWIRNWLKALGFSGYWQLALANECQEWLLYMTHRKVYAPRRVPLGCTDGALFFFQATFQKCLDELLYKHWYRLFELLDHFGFKMSPKKSSLFETEVPKK